MIKYNILIILLSIILFSCTNESQKKQKNLPKETKPKIEIAKFNAESAYYFVEKQVSFGPRVISSKAWLNCANWLEKKLTSYTPNVITQEAPITTYD